MSNTKKILLLFFSVILISNLQFTTPSGLYNDGNLTLEQIADAIFVPEVYASNWPGFVVYLEPAGKWGCHCPFYITDECWCM